MSIKPIDAVPATPESFTRRKMIREDLMLAIGQKITAFEFEGDYNYKYLAQYAREEAEHIFRREVYLDARQAVIQRLKEEGIATYIFPPSEWEYRGRFIRIVNRKGEDRQHVYASIDYDFAAKFEEMLETDTRKKYHEIKQERGKV